MDMEPKKKKRGNKRFRKNMALKIERESKIQDHHINFGGSLRDPANASLSSVPSGSLQPPPLPRDWVGIEGRSNMLAPDAPLPPQSTNPAQVQQPPPIDSTQVRQPPSLPPRLTSVPPPGDPLTPHVVDQLQIRLPPPLPLGLSTTSSLDPGIVRVPQSSERLADHDTDRSGDTQHSSKKSMMFLNFFQQAWTQPNGPLFITFPQG